MTRNYSEQSFAGLSERSQRIANVIKARVEVSNVERFGN